MLGAVVESSTPRLIPVRNRRQAHEWSLALISQGIESTLRYNDETGTWAIEVEGPQAARALHTLKLYHRENRGWGMRQELPGVHLAFHWGCAGWTLGLILVHHLSTLPLSRLHEIGLLSHAVTNAGEWWRIGTAMTLHADLGHLASNAVTGTLLLGLVMGRHGPGVGLLGVWLAAALANVAALQIYPADYRSLGASGMVMAALGILTATGTWDAARRRPGWKPLFGTLAAGFMLFVLTGSNPASDVVVHLGGMIMGLFTGLALEAAHPQMSRFPRLQLAATVLFTGLLTGTWLLALAH